jgi:hypothetical protein
MSICSIVLVSRDLNLPRHDSAQATLARITEIFRFQMGPEPGLRFGVMIVLSTSAERNE